MTAGAGSRAGRRWQAGPQLSSRTSLRTKLVTAVLALVAVALGIMGFVGIAVFGGYLQDQVDSQLHNLNAEVVNDLSDPFALSRGHQPMFVLNNSTIVEVLDSSGQPVAGIGNWQNVPGPSVPASDAGQNGTSGQPVTVPAQSGGSDWRIISQAVNYS